MKKDRDTVKIWCFPYVHGIEIGHVALQINQFVYGFYPARKLSLGEAEAPGDMKKQAESVVAEEYLELYLGSAFLEEIAFLPRGKIISKTNGARIPLAYVYTVEVPSELKQKLADLYENYHAHPPIYHRKENNCVTITIDTFSGILSFNRTYWPENFRKQLVKKVGHVLEEEKGKVVCEEEKEVGYCFTWRLKSRR